MKSPLTLEGQAVRRKLRAAWHGMKWRCTPGNQPNYGDRGIRVCDRWLASFEAFVSDMGPPPTMKHSIDRINNDGNYEPGNCRWATRSQQMRNQQRGTVKLRFQGELVDAVEWAEVMGINYDTVYFYAHYRQVSGEEIIATRWKNRRLVLGHAAKRKLRDSMSISVAASVESE